MLGFGPLSGLPLSGTPTGGTAEGATAFAGVGTATLVGHTLAKGSVSFAGAGSNSNTSANVVAVRVNFAGAGSAAGAGASIARGALTASGAGEFGAYNALQTASASFAGSGAFGPVGRTQAEEDDSVTPGWDRPGKRKRNNQQIMLTMQAFLQTRPRV